MGDGKMDRRAFLEHATVSGSVAAVGPVLPALARGVSRPTPRVPAPFELEEATIAGLQAGLGSGEYNPPSLPAGPLPRPQGLGSEGPAVPPGVGSNPAPAAQGPPPASAPPGQGPP